MSKWIKRLFILVVLAGILTIPSVYAYMYMRVQTVDNTFVVADIFEDKENPVIETVTDNTKTSIKIKNTGNIESYIRVKIITYWQDSKGNIVGRASEKLNFQTTDDWIHDVKNDVYYYKFPIMPGDESNEFLAPGETIKLDHIEEEIEYNSVTASYEYNQVVEINVEGIQANPSKVVETIWGVTLTDRNITSVNK